MKFSIKRFINTVKAVLVSSSGEEVTIKDGAVQVYTPSQVDTNNSSSTALGIGEVFTGVATETLDFAIMYLTVYSDASSSLNGLQIQTSSDGVTNWRNGDHYTITGLTEKSFSFQLNKKFYRVIYTNGAVAQTEFDLQVVLKRTNGLPSSHRISDVVNGEDDSQLIKSVLTAYNEFTDLFVNIYASKSNNLRVTDAENGIAIAKGEVIGSGSISKFGNAHNFDIADGFVNIWDGADNTNLSIPQYTYSTTNDINRISSSNNADTQQIKITGLDINWNEVVQTKTLTGQTPVLLDTLLLRCYRMENIGTTDILGNVMVYTSAATVTAGVPSPLSTIRAVIEDGEGQTLMALSPIPAGKTGYLRAWYFSASGAKRASTHIMKLRARRFGGVFVTKHVQAISLVGSSSIEHIYEVPIAYSEKTDIEMLSNTDEADAGVSGGYDIILVDN